MGWDGKLSPRPHSFFFVDRCVEREREQASSARCRRRLGPWVPTYPPRPPGPRAPVWARGTRCARARNEARDARPSLPRARLVFWPGGPAAPCAPPFVRALPCCLPRLQYARPSRGWRIPHLPGPAWARGARRLGGRAKGRAKRERSARARVKARLRNWDSQLHTPPGAPRPHVPLSRTGLPAPSVRPCARPCTHADACPQSPQHQAISTRTPRSTHHLPPYTTRVPRAPPPFPALQHPSEQQTSNHGGPESARRQDLLHRRRLRGRCVKEKRAERERNARLPE
jgi:hypothetical protein